ncbi:MULTISPECIES: ABC transporter substrate-binding protein [Bifidobacterium]|uniref:ABC transporter substrate-binding protein n=1 Tax=Bifidobacterium TaxID=1678 RepID=UPI001C3846AE|nr:MULTISPECIES: ABC transporter substrate-binding protein [Bifidobacterium]MBV3807169.1 ABC transporter substrate-binding protein [Bifidobacterium adolescentis]MBV3835398.1 ABC transporter substrate-binding protein [Bifidobacterium sp. MSK.17.10]MCG4567020.1 ABC transporter substrate-binding protein [Bifidobacterium adolescentis]
MKKTIFSKAIAILGSIAMLVGVAACGQSNDFTKTATDGNDLTKVTFMLSWAPDTNHIGVYVAKNKGYFKQAGLDVDIVAVAQAGAEQAVNNGMADFALSNLTNVGIYTLKGAKIKQVMQVQQKPSAIWCSLASNKDIKSPKDFDGKTFATFGSNESDAVIRRMIQTDGGKGTFDKVTVGTSTFQTLSSKKADFGGFYATWEGVQADMYGPKLNCFTEPDYGVPGNADTIGVITSDKTISSNPGLVKKFVQATKKGYEYAYSHPDDAAAILVKEAPDANLKLDFVKKSMKTIVDDQYWGDPAKIKDGSFTFGTNDTAGAQKYFDFLAEENAYTDSHDKVIHTAPVAKDISTDEFLK